MRLLGMFFLFVVSVVSSSAQTVPLPPAPSPAAVATNAETPPAVAVTNLPDAVLLQQLLEKMEKLETRAATPPQSDQVDKLKEQLFQAEVKLETEAGNRTTLYTLMFVISALAMKPSS